LLFLNFVKETAPGPGHYYQPAKASSLKVKYKPPRFQFFGSATERFKDNLNAVPGSVDYVSLSRPIPAVFFLIFKLSMII